MQNFQNICFSGNILFFNYNIFCLAFIVNRYSDKIYETEARIKILDKQESSLELPSAEDLFSNSKINLENELEVLKSFTLIKKVVENKKLYIKVEGIGNVKNYHAFDYPFQFYVKYLKKKLRKNSHLI